MAARRTSSLPCQMSPDVRNESAVKIMSVEKLRMYFRENTI